MKRNRKYVLGGFALLLLLLAGCLGSRQKAEEEQALTIFLKGETTVDKSLQEKFPDIKFDFQYYDGRNITSNLGMKVKHHDITDIFIGTLPLEKKDAEENLMDLSGYDFVNNYEESILNQYDIDGRIYQLPSSVLVRCIIYNKKMFEEHGWKEPQNFSELTALARQIREETDDITPIVFAGAGLGYYFTTMTTYAQTQFLYTPEGSEWEKEFLAGNAKAEEGFGAGIQMMQELIDAGAFDYERNEDCWDSELFELHMQTGEAAMQFAWGTQHTLFNLMNEDGEDYAVMPFSNYAGDKFLGTSINNNIGLSKRLEEPENEEKLEDALRVMEWFATEEGQKALTTLSGSVIYPLKNAKNTQTVPQIRELWYANLDGIKAPMIYTGYEDIIVPAAKYIMEAVKGEHDLSGLAPFIDEVHRASLAKNEENKDVYAGSFASDFTHEETAQMMAEMLHVRKDSDITLVSDGMRVGQVKNTDGVHSQFYKGLVPYDFITIFMPGTSSVDASMMQMKLTGKEIQELLEKGKNMVAYEDDKSSHAVEADEKACDSSRYPYYWAGMDVKMKDGKVQSMTLADGTPVKQDKRYTVSFALGDYMDTTEAAGNPVDLGYTAYEAICEYLEKNSPVSPIEVLR